MGKFLKPGKVVIILAGRYAGRKAVIVKTFDEGSSSRRFGHCLVAGIDKYPRKLTKSMSKAKTAKRSAIKPFVQFINFNHVMPTRYQTDLEVKSLKLATGATVDLNEKAVTDPARRALVLKSLRELLEAGYKEQDSRKPGKHAEGVAYLYTRLRF